MRGVSESEVHPRHTSGKTSIRCQAQDPSVAQHAPVAAAEEQEQLSEAWTEPFDPISMYPGELLQRRIAILTRCVNWLTHRLDPLYKSALAVDKARDSHQIHHRLGWFDRRYRSRLYQWRSHQHRLYRHSCVVPRCDHLGLRCHHLNSPTRTFQSKPQQSKARSRQGRKSRRSG